MITHGILLSELENEQIFDVYFTVPRGELKKVFWQIAFTVYDKATIRYSKRGSKVRLRFTRFQELEFRAKLDFYSEEYKKQLDIFTLAFIMKNDLFTKNKDGIKPLTTPDELSKQEQATRMAMGIETSQYHKQLISKNE